MKTEHETKKKGAIVTLPDMTASIGKNGVSFYGILGEIKTKKGDPAPPDPGAAYKGHRLDTMCIAVPGDTLDE